MSYIPNFRISPLYGGPEVKVLLEVVNPMDRHDSIRLVRDDVDMAVFEIIEVWNNATGLSTNDEMQWDSWEDVILYYEKRYEDELGGDDFDDDIEFVSLDEIEENY